MEIDDQHVLVTNIIFYTWLAALSLLFFVGSKHAMKAEM